MKPKFRLQVQSAIRVYVQRIATEFNQIVQSITLYGSQARAEAEAESDIDLLIVVRQHTTEVEQQLVNLAWEVQFAYDVVISDIICDLHELNQMKVQRFPYYQNVEQEGILLWKNLSEHMPVYA